MSGRDEGYYGPSPADLGCGALIMCALVLAGAALVAFLCLAAAADGDAAMAERAGSAAYELNDDERDDYAA